MTAPTCTRCARTLVPRDQWLTKPLAERRTLSRTHAIAEWDTGKCGSCYRRDRREAELAYRGGWVVKGGVQYPRVNHRLIPERTN